MILREGTQLHITFLDFTVHRTDKSEFFTLQSVRMSGSKRKLSCDPFNCDAFRLLGTPFLQRPAPVLTYHHQSYSAVACTRPHLHLATVLAPGMTLAHHLVQYLNQPRVQG